MKNLQLKKPIFEDDKVAKNTQQKSNKNTKVAPANAVTNNSLVVDELKKVRASYGAASKEYKDAVTKFRKDGNKK